MRLCLDEHYSPKIAAELRARGHDAISVHDRPTLLALPDTALLDAMIAEGRAIVTENVGDFVPLARRLALEGRDHFGLILTSSAALPRSRNTIGRHVRALDAFLAERPANDALRNQVAWLSPRD
jgi:predicted nuclease of predicted toxin-antitoxin system